MLLLGASCAAARTPGGGTELPRVLEAESGATATPAPGTLARAHEEPCFGASRGLALRLEGDAGVALELPRIPAGGASLWLRLSCTDEAGGARLEVTHDFGGAVVEVPDTRHRDRFEWIECARLPEGAQRCEIALAAGHGGRARVRIDQWALLEPDRSPPERLSPPVHRDGDGLELRAAEGARLFDPPWILKLLREQRNEVARLLGEPAPAPLVLLALPAASWPQEQAGAFQNGCVIYLRDDELHLPWRSFAHEIFHVHEETLPAELPPFLSEGIACALALEIERRLVERGVDPGEEEARQERLLADGDDLHRPGSGGANPVFAWDRERWDRSAGAAGHAWATALVASARRRGPGSFWSDLIAALRSAGARPIDLAQGLAALERAAGVPLDDLFARAGAPDR
jgi:hypothetical protein